MKTVTINNNTIKISAIDIVTEVVFHATTELGTTSSWVELTVHALNRVFKEMIHITEDEWYDHNCSAYTKLENKRTKIAKAMEACASN